MNAESRPPRIHGIEFLELWVSDAPAIADAYCKAFGFRAVAEAGPETGMPGHRSIVLDQGAARLVVTSSIDGGGPVGRFAAVHGDGVHDIAFAVDDVFSAYRGAVARGARSIVEPHICEGGGCRMVRATIGGFGDVVHSFICTEREQNIPMPRPYRPLAESPQTSTAEFIRLDHVAICLEVGTMNDTAQYYKDVLGFVDGHSEYVETNLSGMNSRVVEHGTVRFPLQEPLVDNPVGQIAEFLRLNDGPGVYHIALLTEDIVRALRRLGDGVKVLQTPSRYYDLLATRFGELPWHVEDLRELSILVDGDDDGHLLQVFTRSLHARRTLFVEIIQRAGAARSFGSGNIRALFDAIERDVQTLAGLDE